MCAILRSMNTRKTFKKTNLSLKKSEQARITRAKLINAAQKRFASIGFTATRFDDVARDLGMTSGVLYHHFQNKSELFEAVVRKCHFEISEKLVISDSAINTSTEMIVAGCMSFINLAISNQYKRIVLIDALSVLGWEKWKSIDNEYSESSLRAGLVELNPNFSEEEILVAARMISGATNESALLLATNSKNSSILKMIEKTLKRIVLSIC